MMMRPATFLVPLLVFFVEGYTPVTRPGSAEAFLAGPMGLPGDYGFDPLCLSKRDLHLFSATNPAMRVLRTEVFAQRERSAILRDYRDAELRHGRLAMLAALAWPIQELAAPSIAKFANRELGLAGLPDVLAETGGRSPSILNGGIALGVVPAFMLAVALAIGSVDLSSLKLRNLAEQRGDEFLPGDFGFDPLQILRGSSAAASFKIQQQEVDHGRVAMLAVTAYVLEEAATGAPITETTPELFEPFIAWPGALSAMDAMFSVASSA